MYSESKFNSKLAPDMGFEFRLEHGFIFFTFQTQALMKRLRINAPWTVERPNLGDTGLKSPSLDEVEYI